RDAAALRRDLRPCSNHGCTLHTQPEARLAGAVGSALRNSRAGRARRCADPTRLQTGAAARLFSERACGLAGCTPYSSSDLGGGRRRGRREGGAEAGFEEPRPAVDTVEILPTPELVEGEPDLVEGRASWPEEGGVVAIETASLPALAGDGPANTAEISAAGHG